jgi:bacterioferritin-associated ferredoxin
MIVCLCRGVRERTVRATLAEGASTVAEIRRACGAGTECGACCPMLAELVVQARGCARSTSGASSAVPALEER